LPTIFSSSRSLFSSLTFGAWLLLFKLFLLFVNLYSQRTSCFLFCNEFLQYSLLDR
jgi:hypothetical protein